ncbi:MAG: FRG domain-containing protein [Cytophagales bacterium]|nr:FRG domain-containing protein [Cytophagales bacterium]
MQQDILHVKIRDELYKLPSDVGSKNFLYTLNVFINDYEGLIETEDYTLIKIDEHIKQSLNNLLELVSLDIRQDIIDNSKYLLATDACLNRERVECHLHNRFSGESCEFSRSAIMGFTTQYGDWKFRYKPANNILNITTEGIEEISKLKLDPAKPITFDDIDAQFILNRLEESKDGHLFRGINRHYFHNDGIAASIYRNNKDLVKHEKLQDHESEIVTNLLSKDLYLPEQSRPISALTDLRHFGKDTCLLDFSEDFKIALFFSCQPTTTIGELLVLDKSEYKQKEDIAYPNKEDFLISPAITDVTRPRVKAQKSVFLYCHQGYLPRETSGTKVNNLLIAPSLKPLFYEYCEYSDEKVYPDFHSFIENPQNFMTKAKQDCQDEDKEEGKEYV